MTAHTPALLDSSNPHGSTLAPNLASSTFHVPAPIERALDLRSTSSWDYPEACRGLAKAKRDGFDDAIPTFAARAIAALAPVGTQALIDRLTLLGMSMANGKAPDQVRSWLHETARLLADLPEDILFSAIDECVKEPGRAFVPSVGEIREKAAAPLRERERTAARLNKVARLIAEGVDVPPAAPERPVFSAEPEPFDETTRCTPAEAAAILAEYGLSGAAADNLKLHLGPPRVPTRADYIAMGIDPRCLDRSRTTKNAETGDAPWPC